jgi:hypothetical protein
MAILRITRRNLDRDGYDAINACVDISHRHPLGLITHAAIETGETLEVVQIWDSEDYARRFDEDVLKPAFEAVGAAMEGEVTVFELHDLVTP